MFGKEKTIKRTRKIKGDLCKQVYRAMRQPQSEDDIRLQEGERITEHIRFGRHIDMDISLCGSYYEDNTDNRPFTEAVLYYDGQEVTRREFDDPKFFGTWKLHHKNKTYCVTLVPTDIAYE